ncbi:MAG: DUF1963 domain-containing protein [Firmicutes bacterium]|nr:DUF1963 domain-containing protein [Bacillota bacterium]
MTEAEVKKVLAEIEKRTSRTGFKINIDWKNKPTSLTQSKFGGMPYWDKKMEYPKGSDGNKLYLLAQINFEEVPENDILPEKGILQFFLGDDDLYGWDDEPYIQKNFRVVFHKEVNKEIKEEDLLDLDIPTTLNIPEDHYLPIVCEVPISFGKTEVFMTEDDYRFYDIFKDISKELGYELNDGEYIDDILSEDEYDKYYDEMNIGSWLIGYPFFTQFDPRENKSELQRYDTLLFQIDSDDNDEIMFGDAGVANFFINGEALKKGDFSDIMYNWDCG